MKEAAVISIDLMPMPDGTSIRFGVLLPHDSGLTAYCVPVINRQTPIADVIFWLRDIAERIERDCLSRQVL